jgi:hypothetical protein
MAGAFGFFCPNPVPVSDLYPFRIPALEISRDHPARRSEALAHCPAAFLCLS